MLKIMLLLLNAQILCSFAATLAIASPKRTNHISTAKTDDSSSLND